VIVSSRQDRASAEFAARHGAYGYLFKPFRAGELHAHLASAQHHMEFEHSLEQAATRDALTNLDATGAARDECREWRGRPGEPIGRPDEIIDEIDVFVTGTRRSVEPDRRLATVLFSDIVGSTERAVDIGDSKWRELLERHHAAIRAQLVRERGIEVKTLGDGFLATFDGPAQAIRGATAIREATAMLDVPVRIGLHCGEIEIMGDDIGGIAVHIAARISALAGSGEVLVSRTVKDLVAGSGISFESRGAHTLKGIPDEWELLAVVD
jgi:class 3 adenylate cyclase